jgi:DNA polymerase-3 subunit gamma/tau
VQWISLAQLLAAGAFLSPSPFDQRVSTGLNGGAGMGTDRRAKGEARPAEYTVLARRYRPQQFADLVGQEHVARALANALTGHRVAHAYLFTGARGVGKTSTARILAKALNCEKGPTPTPCDVCDRCRGITTGEDVDVLEIDGASNRGIDEVREIRGNVQYRPSRARYKIYIIDEVHMLTKEAFNALLKTLEEPPPHVKFIFATTEAQKIPVTILSRCQRFDFAGIGTPGIVARLRAIAAEEGVAADDEALALLARRAGGSMRDAQSLLDQLLAFGGDRLTAEHVHQLLGTAPDDRVVELASAVLGRDPKRALELLGRAADEGLQPGELLDQLIAYWRDLMVVHCAGVEGQELSVTPRHHDTLTNHARSLQLDTILAGLDVLAAAKARTRGSNHGRVLFEMALVRLGRLDDLVSLAQLAQWVGQPRNDGARPVAPPEGVKKKPPAADDRTPPLSGGRLSPECSVPSTQHPVPPAPGADASNSDQYLPQIWKEVISQAGQILAGRVARAGLPAISGPNTLVLRFPPAYNSEQTYCEDPDRLGRLVELLRKVSGRPYQLRVESGSGGGATSQPPAADAGNDLSSRHRRPLAEAEQLPLLQRAIEVLGARFIREQVDEGFGMPAGAARPAGRAAEVGGP